MDQDFNTNIMATDTGRKDKGLVAGIIICSVLAIGGIGFGVYAMMASNSKSSEISDLKTQVTDRDNTITTLEAQNAEKENETLASVADSTKPKGGPYIEDGYFFVPKWNAKYKLSDSLTNYGYAVDQKHQGDSYGDYVVGLTAISKSNYIKSPQASYYNDIFSCSVVTVRAMEDSKKGAWGNMKPDVKFNGLNFVIHDLWRNQNCNGAYEQYAPTGTVANQLKAILSKPENI